MSRIFGNWFSFDGFTTWKLATVGDYAYFFVIIILGILVFAAAIKYLARHRNHEDAVKRAAKRMKKLGGSGAACYCDQWVRVKKDACQCDLICVARDKVYVAKVYHFGLEVIGGVDKREWKFRFSKEERVEPNPLPALAEQKVILTRLFSAAGVRNVPVDLVVIFADTYGTTKFYLPGVKCAVSYSLLKKWRKDRPITGDKYDMKGVKAALEASFKEQNPSA